MLTKTVPGHHVFKHLQIFQNAASSHFIQNLWLVRICHHRNEARFKSVLGQNDDFVVLPFHFSLPIVPGSFD